MTNLVGSTVFSRSPVIFNHVERVKRVCGHFDGRIVAATVTFSQIFRLNCFIFPLTPGCYFLAYRMY